MLFVTVGLSLLSIELDNNIDKKYLGILGGIFSNQADGARQVLSTIASTMMTVAGVTFSMTLISISFAGAQIGPRILSNFMNDRGNQITLGTFVSTFVFCLLVLRTVNGETEGGAEFIPHISVLIAIIFALLSLGGLIYFINHIPQKMSMTESVDSTGDDLLKTIDSLYPEKIGQNKDSNSNSGIDLYSKYSVNKIVTASGKGFIEYINASAIIKGAKKYDCVIEIYRRPGDYVCDGVELICVHSNDNLDDKSYLEIRNSIIWGVNRSNNQDILFPAQLLVEIAARALSPGVNDPYSAIECINQLQAGFVQLSTREIPSKYRYDDDEKLRVVSETINYNEFFDLIMNSMRAFIKTDYLCTKRVLELITFLRNYDQSNSYKDLYDNQANSYYNAFKKNTNDDLDLKNIEMLNSSK